MDGDGTAGAATNTMYSCHCLSNNDYNESGCSSDPCSPYLHDLFPLRNQPSQKW